MDVTQPQNILCGMMPLLIYNSLLVALLLTLLPSSSMVAAFGYELFDPAADLGNFDLSRTIYLNSTYVAYAVAAGAVIILIIAIGLYLYDYYYGSSKSDTYSSTEYGGYYQDPYSYNPYAYVGQRGGYQR